MIASACLLALAPTPGGAQNGETEFVFNEPLPRDWRPPVYPPEAIAQGIEGQLSVEFVVDEQGRTLEPRILKPDQANPILSKAVLEQAARWVFAPATDPTGPVARSLIVPVTFMMKGRGNKPSVSLPLQPELSRTKPPVTLSQPEAPYPDAMLPRKLSGRVEVAFLVSKDGRVEQPAVLFASDAAFVKPSLKATEAWKFKPALQGNIPVASPKQLVMDFFPLGMESKREDVLAANGITGWADAGLDAAPLPLMMHGPVFPREKFVAGETGEAVVDFTVNNRGFVEGIVVSSASQPEFGAALAAAVQTWQFRPISMNGNVTALPLAVKHNFSFDGSPAEKQFQEALAAGVGGAAGLDQKIAPLWRVSPIYPESLLSERPTGQAVIEFIIDRDGRARAPRVVSATHDAFGWSAMTAISQWVFAPLTRQGESTQVRVSIPIGFSPPES
jgi:TonB family protein